MSLGASLFLIAVGAILRFAVTADLAGHRHPDRRDDPDGHRRPRLRDLAVDVLQRARPRRGFGPAAIGPLILRG